MAEKKKSDDKSAPKSTSGTAMENVEGTAVSQVPEGADLDDNDKRIREEQDAWREAQAGRD